MRYPSTQPAWAAVSPHRWERRKLEDPTVCDEQRQVQRGFLPTYQGPNLHLLLKGAHHTVITRSQPEYTVTKEHVRLLAAPRTHLLVFHGFPVAVAARRYLGTAEGTHRAGRHARIWGHLTSTTFRASDIFKAGMRPCRDICLDHHHLRCLCPPAGSTQTKCSLHD